MNLGDILSAAKDIATKLIESGGNIGEVTAQTAEGVAGDTQTATPGAPSLGLKPRTLKTLGQEATHPSPTLDALGVGSAIKGVNDFMSYIAWFFHPLNWLRAAEFLLGIGLMFTGVNMLSKTVRQMTGGVGSAAMSVAPSGRAVREFKLSHDASVARRAARSHHGTGRGAGRSRGLPQTDLREVYRDRS